MPKLPQYTAKVESGGAGSGSRRAVATDFAVDFGGTGNQVERAGLALLNQMGEQESRQALVAASEIRAKYAKALDEAAVSGAPLEPLKEQLSAELSKVGEGFQTKQGVETARLDTIKTTSMFDSAVNDIAVRRAGAEAKQGAEKILNNEAAQLVNSPSYLPAAIENVDRYIETFAGKLSPEARATVKDEMTKRLNAAAAHSMIRLNPEEGLKMLDDNKWDLTPERRLELQGYARQNIEYKRVSAERDRAIAEREKREATEKSMDGYIQRIFKGELGGKLRQQILDDTTLDARSREHLLLTMKAQAKAAAGEERQGDRKIANDLWMAINSRQVFNPQVIVDSVRDHLEGRPGLDTKQADYLLGQMRNLRDGGDQTFRNRFAAEIGRQKTILQGDVVLNATEDGRRTQDAILAAIISAVEDAAEKRRTSTAKGQDPADLLNPDSKDYFFTKANINEIKARVVTQEKDAAVKAAVSAGAVRVNGIGDPALLKVKDGDPFLDENGVLRKMTPTVRKNAEKAAKTSKVEFPVVPSGETPDKIARREAEQRGAKYSDWQQGIGR